MNIFSAIPKPPSILEDDIKKCHESNDYRPILFEWYKFVGNLCNFFACLRRDSPAFTSIPQIHFAVLIGLLNRCSRLMLSNIALSHDGGFFGETTAIIDRCIFESCIKIIWLCKKDKGLERFEQFLADGVKSDLKLKNKIIQEITLRGRKRLVIEQRMLNSIERTIASTGLSETAIHSVKRLPTLSTMIGDGMDELLYIVGQTIGSHHVHGSWTSLLIHYLEADEHDLFHPRDHSCETHVNQYVYIPLIILHAIKSFLQFICLDPEVLQDLLNLLKTIEDEIANINNKVISNDFEVIS